MADAIERNLAAFTAQLREIDAVADVVLKGHLLLEEALDRIIAKYVHDSTKLEAANLRFAQKVALARSISLDESDNSVWTVILDLNALRNKLAHSLEPQQRRAKLDVLATSFLRELTDRPSDEVVRKAGDKGLVTFAVAMCLGFLSTFEDEVTRFRLAIDDLDKAMNPHRHTPRAV